MFGSGGGSAGTSTRRDLSELCRSEESGSNFFAEKYVDESKTIWGMKISYFIQTSVHVLRLIMGHKLHHNSKQQIQMEMMST